MKYEIINPSDKVFIASDNLIDAALACQLLSDGWYALHDENGDTAFPMFADEKWFAEHGVDNPQKYVDTHRIEIAKVLESCEYAHERSSLNNIGKNCRNIAKYLREASLGEIVKE